MGAQASQWAESFSEPSDLKLPCPTCATGHITIVKDSLVVTEPTYSMSSHSHEAWEPDWVTRRFLCRLQCDVKKCGEIVAIAGDVGVSEGFDEEIGYVYVDEYTIRCVYPPPPLFNVPPEVTENVRDHLVTSFSLFWIDISACLNRIRAALENIMDDAGIPRKRKNKHGKFDDLKLHDRIVLFSSSDKSLGDSFMAMKMVGNLGSHGEGVTNRSTAFDVFDLMEDALGELYGKKTKRLSEIKKKLIKTKGKGK